MIVDRDFVIKCCLCAEHCQENVGSVEEARKWMEVATGCAGMEKNHVMEELKRRHEWVKK